MKFSQFILMEVTADEKYEKQYKGKMDREVFDKVVELDPTSLGHQKVGKYVDWIIKNEVTDPGVTEVLTKFEKYKSRIPLEHRDINKLDQATLYDVVASAEKEAPLSKKEKKNVDLQKAKKESDLILKGTQHLIISPKTKFASRFWGAGSDWCTARQSDRSCLFDNYAGRGNLYIIINNDTKEKWQLFVSNNKSSVEYRDSSNDSFDPWETFSDDEQVIQWMEKAGIPDNKDLNPEQIQELAEDFISTIRFSDMDGATPELTNDAIDLVKGMIEYIPDRYEGYDGEATIMDLAEQDLREWDGEFDGIQDELEEGWGIIRDNAFNALNIIGYVNWSDMSYNLNRYRKFLAKSGTNVSSHRHDEAKNFIEDHDWKYYYEQSMDVLMDIIDPSDIDFEFIENWLNAHYKDNFEEVNDFVDNFMDRLTKDNYKISQDDKDELERLVDKVKKVEYGKAGHPKLDLNSLHYRAERYL